jgi:hypothetical protein
MWWGLSLNPKTRLYWAPLDTWPIGLKLGNAALWIEDIDMSSDPYESRLDKVSITYLNAQNRVRMKS